MRCKPFTLCVVEAPVGEGCFANHNGLMFVTRAAPVNAWTFVHTANGPVRVMLPAWEPPEALKCPNCGHVNHCVPDHLLRPIDPPKTPPGDEVKTEKPKELEHA